MGNSRHPHAHTAMSPSNPPPPALDWLSIDYQVPNSPQMPPFPPIPSLSPISPPSQPLNSRVRECGDGWCRCFEQIGGGLPPPPPHPRGGDPSPNPPPPPQTKVTIVKITIGKILSGHLWYTNFWVPKPKTAENNKNAPSPPPAQNTPPPHPRAPTLARRGGGGGLRFCTGCAPCSRALAQHSIGVVWVHGRTGQRLPHPPPNN